MTNFKQIVFRYLSSRLLWVILIPVLLVGVLGLLFFYPSTTFHVSQGGGEDQMEEDTSTGEGEGLFSGNACEGARQRPLAVILAGDVEAQPLSGIAYADMVIEMPVSIDGITRYLALYQCNQPSEIGSVRSARAPFLGLARGYDAILAHWGGEEKTLATLNNGTLDNLDALPNPFQAFWRKEGIPMPHDGFTSFESAWNTAEKLKYELRMRSKDFFTFRSDSDISTNANNSNISPMILTIDYPGKFQVSYHYRPEENRYFRFKGGREEIDALTREQVSATNVVTIWANIYPTYSQYNEVELDGKQGRLKAFIGGKEYDGRWSKEGFTKPLLFFNSEGNPVEFTQGSIWVEVLGLEQDVEVIPLRSL